MDVRTTAEFQGGHVAGSINISLQDLPNQLDKVKSLEQPLVLCCASGGRSGMATQMLQSEGLECYNGGPWLTVNNMVAK